MSERIWWCPKHNTREQWELASRCCPRAKERILFDGADMPRVCGYVYLWGDVCGQSYGRNTAHYGPWDQFHDVIPAALVIMEDTDE